jgi:hypothetical protein
MILKIREESNTGNNVLRFYMNGKYFNENNNTSRSGLVDFLHVLYQNELSYNRM